MAEPWIRVHANLATKPIVLRAAGRLRVSQNEAIGLLVRFWGQMSQHGANGSVSALTDLEIEAWSGWRGKRGVFAAFIRSTHTDEVGRVREWDDYAGQLEDRRTKDRERKRKSRGHRADSPQDVTPISIPARAVRDEDETKRNENYSSSSADAIWIPGRETELAERLANDHDRLALAAILHMAPNRDATVAECHAMLDGMHGAALLPETLGDALRDYVGTGAHHSPNFKHFRGYLRNAQAAGPARVRPSPEAVESELARWARETDARERAHA